MKQKLKINGFYNTNKLNKTFVKYFMILCIP